jgi:hypothetical protein
VRRCLKIKIKKNWGYISVVEHLPNLCEVIGSVLSIEKRRKKKEKAVG